MSKRSPCDEDLSAGHSVQSASPPPLSPAPVSLEYIISQVRDVLTGKAAVRKISNVTSELYQQLDAQAQVDVNLAGWDGVKVDFHRGDLIVGCKVSFGNEIMTALFLDLQRDNTSYPIHYGTSQIRTFGQANIDLTVGSKSPDYALYEVVGDENSTNITPTIAWEIGYAENERKLEMDAARLICLSKGLVQLVVTVKITHEPNTFPKMLKQVVWHHWEIDVARFGQVDDPTNTLLLNNPVPHPQGDQTSPPPYEAHVEIDKDIYRLVAHVTESYHIYPVCDGDEDTVIPILHRHLYRDPHESDLDKVAFRIPFSTVRKVIEANEKAQKIADRKGRWGHGDAEAKEADRSTLNRLFKKKARQA